jgi:hypothetical protein
MTNGKGVEDKQQDRAQNLSGEITNAAWDAK